MNPEQVEKFKVIVDRYNAKDPSLTELERKIVEKVVLAHQKVAEHSNAIQELQKQMQELNTKLVDASNAFNRERAVADSMVALLVEGV